MVALLKRLTDFSAVSNVLQNPTQYKPTHGGFFEDNRKLRSDSGKVAYDLNKQIKIYGKKY